MAAQVLYQGGVLFVYWRGLTALRRYATALHPVLRRYSSSRSEAEDEKEVAELTTGDSPLVQADVQDPTMPGLNIKTGIFGPADSRLSLPGAVGVSFGPNGQRKRGTGSLSLGKDEDIGTADGGVLEENKGDLLVRVLAPLPPHMSAVEVFNNVDSAYQAQLLAMSTALSNVHFEPTGNTEPAPETMLECRAQACPKLLYKDIMTLFPGWPTDKWPMTAITLSQRTVNDMATWGEHMEEEREQLIAQFVTAAKSICSSLTDEGYWADFIDPTSGRPYFGEYTNDTMYETDERYRFLGFTIEDFGCCKVITHKLFGSHVFVGALFTTAPVSSDVLEDALEAHNSSAQEPSPST